MPVYLPIYLTIDGVLDLSEVFFGQKKKTLNRLRRFMLYICSNHLQIAQYLQLSADFVSSFVLLSIYQFKNYILLMKKLKLRQK